MRGRWRLVLAALISALMMARCSNSPSLTSSGQGGPAGAPSTPAAGVASSSTTPGRSDPVEATPVASVTAIPSLTASGRGGQAVVTPVASVAASPASTAPSHSSRAGNTPTALEAAHGNCIVALEGQVHGTVIRTADDLNGSPVYVTVNFSGAPGQRVRVRQGRYSLPLLARRCADGVHWVRFGISAVGVSKAIAPTSPDVRVDLQVGPVPASVPSNLPDCMLVLGTLSGRVFVHGVPAPDDTLVRSEGPPGASNLSQSTTTQGGAYSLPSPGLKCGTEPPRSFIVAVQALGVVVPLAPDTLDIQKDIHVP